MDFRPKVKSQDLQELDKTLETITNITTEGIKIISDSWKESIKDLLGNDVYFSANKELIVKTLDEGQEQLEKHLEILALAMRNIRVSVMNSF